MSDNTTIFNKGMIVEKEEKLKAIKVRINSHKDSFDFEYVKNKLHPERHDLEDLRVLASNLISEIEAYEETFREIEELKKS